MVRVAHAGVRVDREYEMSVQVITHEGQPQYAVLPWDEYQALLIAAGQSLPVEPVSSGPSQPSRPVLSQLAALRQEKGLSLQEMARHVGISPSYLELIERGEREPDSAILRALAWQLGVEGWA